MFFFIIIEENGDSFKRKGYMSMFLRPFVL